MAVNKSYVRSYGILHLTLIAWEELRRETLDKVDKQNCLFRTLNIEIFHTLKNNTLLLFCSQHQISNLEKLEAKHEPEDDFYTAESTKSESHGRVDLTSLIRRSLNLNENDGNRKKGKGWFLNVAKQAASLTTLSIFDLLRVELEITRVK